MTYTEARALPLPLGDLTMRVQKQSSPSVWITFQGDLERGATAVEYALLASLIAAVIAGVVGILGQEVLALFQQLEGAF